MGHVKQTYMSRGCCARRRHRFVGSGGAAALIGYPALLRMLHTWCSSCVVYKEAINSPTRPSTPAESTPTEVGKERPEGQALRSMTPLDYYMSSGALLSSLLLMTSLAGIGGFPFL